MRSLGLTDHDLDWTVSDGLRSVVERVTARLRFFRGSWYQDTEAGTAHIPDVLTRQADTALAARALADAARSVSGVVSVTSSTFRIGPDRSDDLARDPTLVRHGIARLEIATQAGPANLEIAL